MTPGQNCEYGVDPGLDGTLTALSSWRRRCVIYHLYTADGDVASVGDLAATLAEADPGATDSQQHRTVLYHRILPHLHDAGVVEFDRRSDDVRFRGDGIPGNLLECIKSVDHTD